VLDSYSMELGQFNSSQVRKTDFWKSWRKELASFHF
jgi:hypothetical protein